MDLFINQIRKLKNQCGDLSKADCVLAAQMEQIPFSEKFSSFSPYSTPPPSHCNWRFLSFPFFPNSNSQSVLNSYQLSELIVSTIAHVTIFTAKLYWMF